MSQFVDGSKLLGSHCSADGKENWKNLPKLGGQSGSRGVLVYCK